MLHMKCFCQFSEESLKLTVFFTTATDDNTMKNDLTK